MRSNNIVLLAVAVITLGIFALPSTVSLFAGQHTWYNLSGRNSNIPCEKCHADVAKEMEVLVGPHTGETGYGRFDCEYCHRVFYIPAGYKNSSFETYTYAYANGTTTVEPGKEAHAATTVPCMYCHSGNLTGTGWHSTTGSWSDCLSCHGPSGSWPKHGNAKYFDSSDDCKRCHASVYDDITHHVPPAGGFNLTTDTADTGELAAHKTYLMNAISNPDMEDANEACIACHTHIPVKINWTHRYSLEFSCVPEFEKLPPTHFNVTDWTLNGTYNITVYGWRNGTGNTSEEGWPGGYP